jgi:hypothetical protein
LPSFWLTEKKALRGRRLGSDEVKQAVHTWLCDQPKTFFSGEIKKLVKSCKNCVDRQGDYVEKLCNNYASISF